MTIHQWVAVALGIAWGSFAVFMGTAYRDRDAGFAATVAVLLAAVSVWWWLT